jgi:ABC-type uncharacterized transport system YnjBCD ATPase subunit
MNDYALGIKELDNAIGGIKKGSNIMLIGPPMSGKELILNFIIGYRPDLCDIHAKLLGTVVCQVFCFQLFISNKKK